MPCHLNSLIHRQTHTQEVNLLAWLQFLVLYVMHPINMTAHVTIEPVVGSTVGHTVKIHVGLLPKEGRKISSFYNDFVQGHHIVSLVWV